MTLRTYKPLRSRSKLNRVSPKRFEKIGDWHPQRKRATPPEMFELRSTVFNRSDGHCEGQKKNGEPCQKRITWDSFQMHHIIPRSKGGSDTQENCLALCHEDHAEIHGVPQWSLTAPKPNSKQTDFNPEEL